MVRQAAQEAGEEDLEIIATVSNGWDRLRNGMIDKREGSIEKRLAAVKRI